MNPMKIDIKKKVSLSICTATAISCLSVAVFATQVPSPPTAEETNAAIIATIDNPYVAEQYTTALENLDEKIAARKAGTELYVYFEVDVAAYVPELMEYIDEQHEAAGVPFSYDVKDLNPIKTPFPHYE